MNARVHQDNIGFNYASSRRSRNRGRVGVQRRLCTRETCRVHTPALARRLHTDSAPHLETCMPSRNIGKKRDTGRDVEIPAELAKREAQDRAKGDAGGGKARSP